ncbi:MAG: 3-phosphoshikimate 1-carboxyvinyltransferase [Phycisphaerales bacterium]|nr:3-phosphoshikimate 1-carboxyvinyltransferase [Phycisphaerales bacterium]
MLGAIASGPSTLRGLLMSDDTAALLAGVEALGVGIAVSANQVCMTPPDTLGAQPEAQVNLGHGGTPARFMMALASLGRGEVLIDGSARLRERPMGDGLDLLAQVGIAGTWQGEDGNLPVTIHGGPWNTPRLEVGEAASSQFVSAMLLAAPATEQGICVTFQEPVVSESYVRLTVHELQSWGLDARLQEQDGQLHVIEVPPGRPAPQMREVPPDASSALFWAAAAAILPGSSITLTGVTLEDDQPDSAAIGVLASMGMTTEQTEHGLRCLGPDQLSSPGTIDCALMPDAAPALAVACCWASSQTRLTGLSTLRAKESDRVSTIAGELNRAGFDVTIDGDDLIVVPSDPEATPVTLQTWDDHRIAMAMAVMGLRRGQVEIADPEVTSKSYPGFWVDLGRLYGSTESGDTAPQ